jgi:hypothetical protein
MWMRKIISVLRSPGQKAVDILWTRELKGEGGQGLEVDKY